MTNLKRIIDEKGVQQRWLAEQVGVTEVSMSRYVNGERIPKAPMAIRMADVLGVDVKELYGRDDKHVVGEPEQPETHSVCLDTINRQAAIDMLMERASNLRGTVGDLGGACSGAAKLIAQLPPAQPDIIQCRNCKFASGDSRICMKFGHSPIGELDFCAWAERRTDDLQ